MPKPDPRPRLTTLKGALGSRSWTFVAPDSSFTVRVGEHAAGYELHTTLRVLTRTFTIRSEADTWPDVDRALRKLGIGLETLGRSLQSIKLEEP